MVRPRGRHPRQLRDAQQSCRYPTREYQLDRPSLKMAPPRSLSGIRVSQLAHRAVGRINSPSLTSEAISTFVRTAQVGDARYWLWSYKESDGEAKFVTCRVASDGSIELALASANGLNAEQFLLAEYYDEVYWA